MKWLKISPEGTLLYPKIHIGKSYTLVRERKDMVNPKPCWVFVDGKEGYLYIEERLTDLIRLTITEWRKDKHFCG